jgi:hypothetical protein
MPGSHQENAGKTAMNVLKSLGILAAVIFFTIAPHAETPEETQKKAAAEAKLIKETDGRVNQKCGTSIKASFNWDSVPMSELFSKYGIAGQCTSGAIEGIRQVCGEAVGREAVKEQIKSIVCAFGKPRALSLKDGILTYKIDFDSVNDREFVYEWLENRL